MGIQLQNHFTVEASPADTYSLLVDVERVAPCIPGAELTETASDGSHQAQMSMRVGPMKLVFKGVVRVAEQDDTRRHAMLVAEGREQRGQGTAQATMQMQVEQSDTGGSQVTIETDVNVVGRLAQIGSGVMADVASRMISEMAKCMEATLQEPPSTAGGRDATDASSDAPMLVTDSAGPRSNRGAVSRDASGPVHSAPPPPPRQVVKAKPPRLLPLLLDIARGRLRALVTFARGKLKTG